MSLNPRRPADGEFSDERTGGASQASGTSSRQKAAPQQGKPNGAPSGRRGSSAASASLPGVKGVKVKKTARRKKPQEPEWVRNLAKEMPPYADEVVAFLLVTIGLLSFFTVLSPASGALGTAWSGALQRWFGIGAYIVSTAIMAAGATMLLPKLNVDVKLNWWRIIGGEFVFVFLLAYIHAMVRYRVGGEAGRIEAFARAIEGHGGGLVGWAIQDLLYGVLGEVATGGLLLVLLALSAMVMIGVRKATLIGSLNRLHDRFMSRVDFIDATELHEERIAAGHARAARLSVVLNGINTSRLADAAAQVEAQRRMKSAVVVELPSLPGRPSIVTGDVGAGATVFHHRAKPAVEEVEEPKFVYNGRTLKRELQMRFTVNELNDKKRLGKREEVLPDMDTLDAVDFARPSEEEVNLNAQTIEEAVEDFGMAVEVVGVKSGPTVTQYAVSPITTIEKDGKTITQRVRVTRVASLGNDMALALAAPSVRIQAPIPGTKHIGIEVPNSVPGVVSLRPVFESEQFYKIKSPLALALGREVDGTPFATDLAAMPHLLIGGSTGSGKSVCIQAIATCLIMNNRPDELKLVMIDPKMVEMVRFNGLPHLLGHVEVELERIIGVLRWVTREMERRYKLMEEAQSRNIDSYNHGRRKESRLPRMVVLIDELAELMTEYHDETEHLITRLAQMARATGIHLVVATQRPSTDVVTGLIKANFPARIAFAVPSGIDSRVIIDSVGAQDLIGRGDMLFQAADAMGPVRLQGCYVSDIEIERVVDYWIDNWDEDDTRVPPWERALTRAAVLDETDDMLEHAIRVCQAEGEASASMLQRRLNIGYPRAGRIVDALYEMKIIGDDPGGGRPREVLIDKEVDPTNYIINWRLGQ